MLFDDLGEGAVAVQNLDETPNELPIIVPETHFTECEVQEVVSIRSCVFAI